MVSELQATDIPVTRVDVLHILALNEDDLDRLSPEQVAAVRAIYHLDSDLSVEQLVCLTDGMQDETESINRYQRGEP